MYHILCINSGSSSMKFALFLLAGTEDLIVEGEVERIGLPGGRLWIRDGHGKHLEDKQMDFPDHMAAVKAMFTTAMDEHHLPVPDGIGQRVALGGPNRSAPEIVTPGLLLDLRKYTPRAPLHIPPEIKGIEAVTRHYPDLKQVVCFDTAFHCTMPDIAKWVPLTRSLRHEGVHRYGFHGLSYEYIVSALGNALEEKAVIAHLGNGASMAALINGEPQDTTMSFSALGGLMMGTRCGDLDPGFLMYLMYEKGYDVHQLNLFLNEHTGLLGVSGISPDMKILLDKRTAEPHAAQAIELFCYTARKFLGALSAVIGGLDVLVFTGGIGERVAPVRWMICHGLEYLGVHLDPGRNDANADIVSLDGSACTVRVVHTNEDLMIARHTKELLFGGEKEKIHGH